MMDFLGGTVLVLAIAIDALFRELPNRWHPVAWMGSVIGIFTRSVPSSGRFVACAAGTALIVGGVTLCVGLGWGIERLADRAPLPLAALLQAVVLKQTFTVRSLARAARGVQAALGRSELSAARQQLAYHLVSRDVSQLDKSQVAAATIESVTENTSDSIVAPLFYFAVAGLPGALAYRFVNTCDAMLGYRTERFEWLGKPAARLDDLLNLIPARLTALLILAVGGLMYRRLRSAAAIWWRDCRLTASPNAGHPMSAAAGVLGVELEKVGHYRLGSGQRSPEAADIGRAVWILWLTSAAAAGAVLVGLAAKGAA